VAFATADVKRCFDALGSMLIPYVDGIATENWVRGQIEAYVASRRELVARLQAEIAAAEEFARGDFAEHLAPWIAMKRSAVTDVDSIVGVANLPRKQPWMYMHYSDSRCFDPPAPPQSQLPLSKCSPASADAVGSGRETGIGLLTYACFNREPDVACIARTDETCIVRASDHVALVHTPSGTVWITPGCEAEAAAVLASVGRYARRGIDFVRDMGRKTGSCCMCNRRLVRKDRGCHPKCAELLS
jgi:hypothetical protein